VVLAGGAPGDAKGASLGPARRKPVYVGVCANDHASAPAARALGQLLGARGWPSRIDEQPVGHEASDAHVGRALAWLRGLKSAQ
jgi:hypothetical protein